jgi:hypothetical protein
MKPPKTPPVVIHLKRRTGKLTGAMLEAKPKPAAIPQHTAGPSAPHREINIDSVQAAWVLAFGDRLKIDKDRGLWLDKLPINLGELMIRTNRWRKDRDMPQVGKNPQWLV